MGGRAVYDELEGLVWMDGKMSVLIKVNNEDNPSYSIALAFSVTVAEDFRDTVILIDIKEDPIYYNALVAV